MTDREREIHRRSYEKHRERRLADARAWKQRNAAKVRTARAAYYANNKPRELEANLRWMRANPSRRRELGRRFNLRHSDRIRAKRRSPASRNKKNRRERERYAQEPKYCVEKRLRAALTQAVRKAMVGKSAGTFDLVGCTPAELVGHLERRFVPGMSWERRAEIEIDHIRPVSSFDLTDDVQQRQCFHFSNLQPLWKEDNRRKGARTPP
jgi:hypothetical protein